MANEISVNMVMSVANGNYNDSVAFSSLRFDQATNLAVAQVLTVATATQTLTLGDVTVPGFAAFRNLSTDTSGTAYIALGAYVGTNLHEFVQLNRGEPAMLPLSDGVTVGAKAYGSVGRLQYVILSE